MIHPADGDDALLHHHRRRRSRPAVLQAALAEAVEETFNTITVDGDMSTNDTVIALANGRARARATSRGTAPTSSSCRRRWSACAASWRAPSPPTARGRPSCWSSTSRARPSASWRATSPARSRAAAWSSRASSAAIRPGAGSWRRSAPASGARGLPLDLARVALDIQGVRVYSKGAPVAFDAKALAGAHEEGRDRRAAGSGRRQGVGARARLRPDVRLRQDQRRVLHAARPRPAEPAKRGLGRGQPAAGRRGAELHPQVRRQARASSNTAARRWSTRRSSAASPRRWCCCSRPASSR